MVAIGREPNPRTVIRNAAWREIRRWSRAVDRVAQVRVERGEAGIDDRKCGRRRPALRPHPFTNWLLHDGSGMAVEFIKLDLFENRTGLGMGRPSVRGPGDHSVSGCPASIVKIVPKRVADAKPAPPPISSRRLETPVRNGATVTDLDGDASSSSRSAEPHVPSNDDTPEVEGPVTALMTRDAAGVITSVDELITEMLGWQPEQLIGSPSTQFIHPEDQASAIAAWMSMITSPGTPSVWRGRYQAANGMWTWVETVNRLEDSDDPIVSSSMTRISVEQASMEDELRAREQLLTRLSDALPVGLFQIDLIGNVTFTNDRFHTIVGQLPVATIEAQMSPIVAEDRPLLDAALAAVLSDQPVDDIELRLRLPTADATHATEVERVCLLSLRALTDSAGVVTGAVGCLSDVTDGVQLRRELEVRASVDELTSCLNRAASLELLGRITATPNAKGMGNALIFIDLDRFKSVNDRFGHAAGDRLLVAAADRLRAVLRDRDEIGRLGGDEFLVISPRVESSAAAVKIAERIAAATTASIDVGPGVVKLRTSVGVAWTTEPLDADAFIARADNAMYESKRTGRKGVSLFTADIPHPSAT